jgi:hypothetical protein
LLYETRRSLEQQYWKGWTCTPCWSTILYTACLSTSGLKWTLFMHQYGWY